MPANQNIKAALSLIENDPSKILGLTVGEYKVTPGLKIPKAEAQSPPEISFNNATTGTYIVIGLDIDAPFASLPILGPILHWIQPGFKPEPTANDSTTPTPLTAADTPFIANYIGPAPPPPSGPHRYIFLLYEQPEDFDVKKYAPADGKKVGNVGRIRYDLTAFEKKAKLGPVVAANYFVSN